jgi:hypothetical protein
MTNEKQIVFLIAIYVLLNFGVNFYLWLSIVPKLHNWMNKWFF